MPPDDIIHVRRTKTLGIVGRVRDAFLERLGDRRDEVIGTHTTVPQSMPWVLVDEGQHPTDYLPIILVNDVVRYWRILLLNHESRLREKAAKQGLSPEDEMALRRYSSYKLRVPRCLTCFSALSYLLALTPSEPAHVKRDDIVRMVQMTPIARLESLRQIAGSPLGTLGELERLYVRFLERTDSGKTALTDELKADQETVIAVSRDGRDFTRHMFDLIQALGGGRPLHRAIVV